MHDRSASCTGGDAGRHSSTKKHTPTYGSRLLHLAATQTRCVRGTDTYAHASVQCVHSTTLAVDTHTHHTLHYTTLHSLSARLALSLPLPLMHARSLARMHAAVLDGRLSAVAAHWQLWVPPNQSSPHALGKRSGGGGGALGLAVRLGRALSCWIKHPNPFLSTPPPLRGALPPSTTIHASITRAGTQLQWPL